MEFGNRTEKTGSKEYAVRVLRAHNFENYVSLNLEFSEIGLKIYGAALRKNSKNGAYFVAFPSKEGKDREGNKAYYPIVTLPFTDKMTESVVSQVMELVK